MSEESTTPDLVELTWHMFDAPAGTWSPGAVVDRFTSFYAHVFVWEQGMVKQVVSSGDTAEARAAAERLAEERG